MPIVVGTCCHFLVNSTIVWYLAEPESRPASGDDADAMLLKDGTEASGKLTKDKIHVEELRLPEIMIPVTKTKGKNRDILCKFLFLCPLPL